MVLNDSSPDRDAATKRHVGSRQTSDSRYTGVEAAQRRFFDCVSLAVSSSSAPTWDIGTCGTVPTAGEVAPCFEGPRRDAGPAHAALGGNSLLVKGLTPTDDPGVPMSTRQEARGLVSEGH